jgi:hypothetical protein
VVSSPAAAAGDRSTRGPLPDPMTADQACASLPPKLSLAARARSDCRQSSPPGLQPGAPLWPPGSCSHVTTRGDGRADVKLGAANANPAKPEAKSWARGTAVGWAGQTDLAARRSRRRGIGRGADGAYWPRLASCVLRGGSARSRSMRSTSA